LSLGFKAKIIVVNTTMINVKYLGQDLSDALIKEIEEHGADACGENGEYHTVVYDGPLFQKPVELKYGNKVIPVGEKWAQIEVSIR